MRKLFRSEIASYSRLKNL